MIRGQTIERLIDLFDSRGVRLFHACELLDFGSYVRVGGVPSHACLEARHESFTPLDTDQNDKGSGVWDRVFVNLSDFGKTFANGGKGVPNPYGPVLIQIRAAALREAVDVAICLRSAGATGFDRDVEALQSIEDVDRLFENAADAGYPLSTFVKFRAKLREEFGNPGAADPEISCTVNSGYLSFEHVEAVIVDPYTIGNSQLIDHVRALMPAGIRNLVRERTCRTARSPLYNELATIIEGGVPSLEDIIASPNVSQDLATWSQDIINIEWQFSRFARYLRYGTLCPLLGLNP